MTNPLQITPSVRTPVCHSSVALLQPNSPVCQVCQHQKDCVRGAVARVDQLPDAPEVRNAKAKLIMFARVIMGSPQSENRRISVSRRGIVRRNPTKDEQARLEGMSARAASMANRLVKRGWFDLAHHSMAMGRHPGGDDALAMVCQLLLDGGIRRRELVPTLMDRFDMTKTSANVAASTLVAVLAFGELATVTQGRLVYTPSAH